MFNMNAADIARFLRLVFTLQKSSKKRWLFRVGVASLRRNIMRIKSLLFAASVLLALSSSAHATVIVQNNNHNIILFKLVL